ncbi:MAG: hypothetical protein GXP08_05610 [Gammaproteobacteria bacterium]|nr:hypothetical protein [Gammaproteobacteria bacterium]
MLENVLLLGVAIIFVMILFQPRLRQSRDWRATVTPLASIIGSGFLVAAPLLSHAVNSWALLAMAGIVLLAYGIGEVIRYNIRYAEPLLNRSQAPNLLLVVERLSGLVLSIAYVISVAFYLRLLASFVLRAMEMDNDFLANTMTTAILIFIALMGWRRGLGGLEVLEESAVNIKLSIIIALLFGLAWFDVNWLLQAGTDMNYRAVEDWVYSLQLLAGILLIVQGFETSRYLGAEYDAETRIRTMRYAQILSGIIYLLFVGLSLPLLSDFHEQRDETAIITLSANVAVVLPAMLIVAAVMSQFSAAIADTAGSGGLLSEFSRQRLMPRFAYALVAAVAIILVWSASIFEIIAIASRAFAFYYLFQCLVALIASRGRGHFAARAGFVMIAGILMLVVVFAIPDGG